MALPGETTSTRSYILAWTVIPLLLILIVDTVAMYQSALRSVTSAYDRTLVATAHAVGDAVRYEQEQFRVSLPLALFEIYEAEQSGRYYFRVSRSDGELITGDEDLPFAQNALPSRNVYPSLVTFYEDTFREQPVRVAMLTQPVFSNDAKGTVIIQIAEPLKIRHEAARDLLEDTLLRQGVLIIAIVAVLFLAVTRSLKSLYQLRHELEQRRDDDLSALSLRPGLREVQTVVMALNDLMERVGRLVDSQKRFIANASHQLRTPLAVLKTQLQSGLRGDVPAQEVMREMEGTVERSIQIANQMLLLAKVEQRRTQVPMERCRLDRLAREAALELSPLIAEKDLDFAIEDSEALFLGDAWLVGELIRNLLSNAIRHTPHGQQLGIRVGSSGDVVTLTVWDTGGGLSDKQIEHAFQPFSSSFSHHGSGLGLSICQEIAVALRGSINLSNWVDGGRVRGLKALVQFPAA